MFSSWCSVQTPFSPDSTTSKLHQEEYLIFNAMLQISIAFKAKYSLYFFIKKKTLIPVQKLIETLSSASFWPMDFNDFSSRLWIVLIQTDSFRAFCESFDYFTENQSQFEHQFYSKQDQYLVYEIFTTERKSSMFSLSY